MNSRIRRIEFNGIEIISIDYSHCKEAELIAITNEHKELILTENKVSFFLANYKHTYGTPNYMKAAKDFTQSTRHLVKKGAFLGITGPKVYLLKGITFFIDVDFKTFENEEEALEWLIS